MLSKVETLFNQGSTTQGGLFMPTPSTDPYIDEDRRMMLAVFVERGGLIKLHDVVVAAVLQHHLRGLPESERAAFVSNRLLAFIEDAVREFRRIQSDGLPPFLRNLENGESPPSESEDRCVRATGDQLTKK